MSVEVVSCVRQPSNHRRIDLVQQGSLSFDRSMKPQICLQLSHGPMLKLQNVNLIHRCSCSSLLYLGIVSELLTFCTSGHSEVAVLKYVGTKKDIRLLAPSCFLLFKTSQLICTLNVYLICSRYSFQILS